MNIASPRRAYRQSVRALAAEATGERILDAFAGALSRRWYDEIRLDDVARDAGVSVQTVIRRFGSKEGLLEAMHRRLAAEISARRDIAGGDADAAVASLIEDYEAVGDLVLRTLAQEDRYPSVKAMTDTGRVMHRAWIERAFAPWLEAIEPGKRRRAADALVVAADIYVWKLVRRDMQRPLADYRALVETMCAAALGADPALLFNRSRSGASE